VNILFLVVTTRKYHDTRVRAVRQTWANSLSSKVFFFTDGDGDSPQFVNLHISSGYHSASLKNVLALVHAWTYLGGQAADWVMVSDDDTFVYVDSLRQFLRDKNPSENVCYGNKLNHYPELPDLIYPSGGAGYVLSCCALASLQIPLHQCRLYPFSDVTVGVCMTDAKTRFVAAPGFNSQPPEVAYPELDSEKLKAQGFRGVEPHPITFHYVQPDRMIELYAQELKDKEQAPSSGLPAKQDWPASIFS
jgi:hypothetical protein